jgi:hypothetical protein
MRLDDRSRDTVTGHQDERFDSPIKEKRGTP